MSTKPRRIQLQRTAGWHKPEGAIVVSRPSRWGNPFTVAGCIENDFAITREQAQKVCVEAFEGWLCNGSDSQWWFENGRDSHEWMTRHLWQLRGKDLCCWCKEGTPCHASTLLRMANA